MQVFQLVHALVALDRDRRHDARERGDAQRSLGRHGGKRSVELVAVLGPHLVSVLVEVRRVQEELVGFDPESLLVDAAFSEQDGHPAAEQHLADQRPFLERDR